VEARRLPFCKPIPALTDPFNPPRAYMTGVALHRQMLCVLVLGLDPVTWIYFMQARVLICRHGWPCERCCAQRPRAQAAVAV
jgi:hypothetical protein